MDVCACAYIYVCGYMCVCMYVNICMYICVYICVCVYIRKLWICLQCDLLLDGTTYIAYEHVCLCKYVCMYVCMYVFISHLHCNFLLAGGTHHGVFHPSTTVKFIFYEESFGENHVFEPTPYISGVYVCMSMFFEVCIPRTLGKVIGWRHYIYTHIYIYMSCVPIIHFYCSTQINTM